MRSRRSSFVHSPILALLLGLSVTSLSEARSAAATFQSTAFVKNMGQWPDSILFRASVDGATLWITKDGIYHQYFRHVARPGIRNRASHFRNDGLPDLVGQRGRVHDTTETTIVKAEFLGSNPSVEVLGLGEMSYRCNYFLGNDRSKWRTDVPTYGEITMKNIYPGVDLLLRSQNGRLIATERGEEKARSAVRIGYNGGTVLRMQGASTVLRTRFGDRAFDGILPHDSATLSDRQVQTAGRNPGAVTLGYSSYLGGGGTNEMGLDIEVDATGSAYVTGYTESNDFPTQNPSQSFQGGLDAFVSKLNSDGASLIYSTYIGGSGAESGEGVAIDELGSAYVAGVTTSDNFPTVSAFQTDRAIDDAFVVKLSPSGNVMHYCTYLGGSAVDVGWEVAVDQLGSAYVTGETYSTDFPVYNPYQLKQGSSDVFVTKLNATGHSLYYSTLLGGSSGEVGYDIAVDVHGAAYVTGETSSDNFPTKNGIQGRGGKIDAFVTKFSTSGSTLAYSTFLGGSELDAGMGIAVDRAGAAYVTGYTSSSNYPTRNPIQGHKLEEDVVVTKLSPAGNELLYSTYLSGTYVEIAYGIAVDVSGAAYVTGGTSSPDFPTLHPLQLPLYYGSAFVSKLDKTGTDLIYSTTLGGSQAEDAASIAVDRCGAAYIIGTTSSSNFPTLNPIQADRPGDDPFVTKLIAPDCCIPATRLRGDVFRGDGSLPEGDGVVDGSDLQAYVDYFFFDDATWLVGCTDAQDLDRNCIVDSGDLGVLIDYMFFGITSVIRRCDGSSY